MVPVLNLISIKLPPQDGVFVPINSTFIVLRYSAYFFFIPSLLFLVLKNWKLTDRIGGLLTFRNPIAPDLHYIELLSSPVFDLTTSLRSISLRLFI